MPRFICGKGLCRDGGVGGSPSQAAGVGERAAEAAGGGPDSRQVDAAGCSVKKAVKPAGRREVVWHYQDVFALSERGPATRSGIGAADAVEGFGRKPGSLWISPAPCLAAASMSLPIGARGALHNERYLGDGPHLGQAL